MKYIRTCDANGTHEIFLFPRTVNHDCMMEMLSRIKDTSGPRWKRVYREAVTAGFVDISGMCYGGSDTLGLKSDPSDTALLNSRTSFGNQPVIPIKFSVVPAGENVADETTHTK